jgi:hypothetical protein
VSAAWEGLAVECTRHGLTTVTGTATTPRGDGLRDRATALACGCTAQRREPDDETGAAVRGAGEASMTAGLGTVKVLHNVSRDAWFGLNARPDAPGATVGAPVYEPRAHELVAVFETPLDAELLRKGGLSAVAEWLFMALNVGDDPELCDPASGAAEVARAYRARRLRSLSVGDVLLFGDGVALACERMGFREVAYADLGWLTAADAEPVIRERYEIWGEPLTVTVPLPDGT